MAEKHRNQSTIRGTWNKVFDFLIEHPEVTRNPIECQISKGNIERIESELRTLREHAHPVVAQKLQDLEHASGVYEQDIMPC